MKFIKYLKKIFSILNTRSKVIEQAYMITCPSSERWKNYKGLDFIEKVNCVNSVEEGEKMAKQRGFKVQIRKREYLHHFKKCKGAFGCFLSHYYVWSKIYRNYISSGSNKRYLILEDDVCPGSLVDFWRNRHKIKLKDNSVLNLRVGPAAWGSESYVVDSKGCASMIRHCNKVISYPVDKFLFHILIKRSWSVDHESKINRAAWSEQSSLI